MRASQSPNASRTGDDKFVGEHLPKAARGREWVRIELVELKLFARCRRVRDIDLQLAAGRRTHQRDRRIFARLEVHENRRIVDFDLQPFRYNGRLQRKHEVQRQERVLELHPIVDRIDERDLFAVHTGIGEIVELLQAVTLTLANELSSSRVNWPFFACWIP